MSPPQEESLRSLLTRSDFASLDVPLATVCTWIGDGWLEQVGTAPTADGSTGEPVYAIISRQLRAELLPKLQQIGKADAALTPIRARSQLLRLMLARKGILLPFDRGDDLVSVKSKLIEELAAGLLGPDLARALEEAAGDLEREVEAALQQLDGLILPETSGSDPAQVEAVETGEAEAGRVGDGVEEVEIDDEEPEWFDTSDLLDETSVWADEADAEDEAPEATEDAADTDPQAAGPEAVEGMDVGEPAAEAPTDAVLAAPATPAPPEAADDEVDAQTAHGAAPEQPLESAGPAEGPVDEVAPELAVHTVEAPTDAEALHAEASAPELGAEDALARVDVVMAAEDGPPAQDLAGTGEPVAPAADFESNDERVTEDELASLAGNSNLLDFGVTFRDGLTEEEVTERLVPQVTMTITDTLIAMLGDENAPFGNSVSHNGSGPKVDLQPLTTELEQLRLAMLQLSERKAPAVDMTTVAQEVGQLRAVVQQFAERQQTGADLTPVTQELAKLCSLVELLADRRGDPPGLQKIASALELGFARVATAPAEVSSCIKGLSAAIRETKAANAETMPAQPAPRAPFVLPRANNGSLVPVAAIGFLLVCWAVVLYVKFGDARLALGSLLAVSMIGSTLVAFRRD